MTLSRIGIYFENVFVECRINPDNILHLMVNLQLQRQYRSVGMDSIQIVEQENLTVVLPKIARFRPLCCVPGLDSDHVSAVVLAMHFEGARKTYGIT
jgi:hypothetical protein